MSTSQKNSPILPTLYRLITVPAKVALVFPAAVLFGQSDARVLIAVASKHVER